jgi:hypothetical protein
MNRRAKLLLVAAAGLVGVTVARNALAARRTERVPYDVLDTFEGVELRQYPLTVQAETTAPTEGAAFGRLFRYISGNNEADAEVSMTAPVVTEERGQAVPMTAPVRSSATTDGTTMGFYLPASYTPETAPVPTDPRVRLVVEPPRTVAVRRFSWWASADRVASEADRLLDVVEDRGWTSTGDPTLMRYDPPWTPPFLRTNEVAVTVER